MLTMGQVPGWNGGLVLRYMILLCYKANSISFHKRVTKSRLLGTQKMSRLNPAHETEENSFQPISLKDGETPDPLRSSQLPEGITCASSGTALSSTRKTVRTLNQEAPSPGGRGICNWMVCSSHSYVPEYVHENLAAAFLTNFDPGHLSPGVHCPIPD